MTRPPMRRVNHQVAQETDARTGHGGGLCTRRVDYMPKAGLGKGQRGRRCALAGLNGEGNPVKEYRVRRVPHKRRSQGLKTVYPGMEFSNGKPVALIIRFVSH
jgi:hypothetical protein